MPELKCVYVFVFVSVCFYYLVKIMLNPALSTDSEK